MMFGWGMLTMAWCLRHSGSRASRPRKKSPKSSRYVFFESALSQTPQPLCKDNVTLTRMDARGVPAGGVGGGQGV